ncbi:MAG: amino acid ABC transporter permease [Actinobacteria bacterium]|nr:amino acid ABC transporter permease [Actinomycetota bacterium]
MLDLVREYDVLGAFWVTVQLTVYAAVGSLVIGTVIAILRVSPVRIFSWAGAMYVNVVRNTPLTLIVFFLFFCLYQLLGWHLAPLSARSSTHAFVWGVVGLSLYHASFVAEALRSGINTVGVGQAEAARSIGLDFGQSLREVILPQAFRGAIAPLGNTMIALTKNTTVVSTIGVAEASYAMKNAIEFSPNVLYLIFAVMSLGFVVLTLPMGVLFTQVSRRLAVQR